MQNIRLTELLYVAATVGSIYTNAAATKSFVRGFVLHNTNTTAEVVQLHWVPDSSGSLGTAATSNRFFYASLAANETLLVELPFPFIMTDTNEAIFGVTTTASKVTVAVLGDKE